MIKINKDLCIGCGACESMCSKIFKMEDGKSHVISDDCAECNMEEIIDVCPVSAISEG